MVCDTAFAKFSLNSPSSSPCRFPLRKYFEHDEHVFMRIIHENRDSSLKCNLSSHKLRLRFYHQWIPREAVRELSAAVQQDSEPFLGVAPYAGWGSTISAHSCLRIPYTHEAEAAVLE